MRAPLESRAVALEVGALWWTVHTCPGAQAPRGWQVSTVASGARSLTRALRHSNVCHLTSIRMTATSRVHVFRSAFSVDDNPPPLPIRDRFPVDHRLPDREPIDPRPRRRQANKHSTPAGGGSPLQTPTHTQTETRHPLHVTCRIHTSIPTLRRSKVRGLPARTSSLVPSRREGLSPTLRCTAPHSCAGSSPRDPLPETA